MSKHPIHFIYGLHTVQAILERAPQQVLSVQVQAEREDARLQRIITEVERHGLALQRVSDKQLDKQLGAVNHQGVMAQVRAPRSGDERDLLTDLAGSENPLLLVLDGVQDPHNLGACLRSADAAGAQAVVVPRDRACGLTPTVSKVASGAAELLPFYQVTNLARSLRSLREELGVHCIGLAGEAQTSLYHCELTGPLALVLGAEGSGLRRLTRETCDTLARLPMLGAVESLNVSVSAGVALYEAVRQRLTTRPSSV